MSSWDVEQMVGDGTVALGRGAVAGKGSPCWLYINQVLVLKNQRPRPCPTDSESVGRNF